MVATCHMSHKASCRRDAFVKVMQRPDFFFFLLLFYLRTTVCTQRYSGQNLNAFQVWMGYSEDMKQISPQAVGAIVEGKWKRGSKSVYPQIIQRQRYVCAQVQSVALPVPLETRPFYLSSSRTRGNVGYATTAGRLTVKNKRPFLYSRCLFLVNMSCCTQGALISAQKMSCIIFLQRQK